MYYLTFIPEKSNRDSKRLLDEILLLVLLISIYMITKNSSDIYKFDSFI